MRENTDQKNSEYGHFLRSVIVLLKTLLKSLMERFENILAVNVFRNKVSLYMYDRVQKMLLALCLHKGLQKCNFEIHAIYINYMPG